MFTCAPHTGDHEFFLGWFFRSDTSPSCHSPFPFAAGVSPTLHGGCHCAHVHPQTQSPEHPSVHPQPGLQWPVLWSTL